MEAVKLRYESVRRAPFGLARVLLTGEAIGHCYFSGAHVAPGGGRSRRARWLAVLGFRVLKSVSVKAALGCGASRRYLPQPYVTVTGLGIHCCYLAAGRRATNENPEATW